MREVQFSILHLSLSYLFLLQLSCTIGSKKHYKCHRFDLSRHHYKIFLIQNNFHIHTEPLSSKQYVQSSFYFYTFYNQSNHSHTMLNFSILYQTERSLLKHSLLKFLSNGNIERFQAF